MDNARTLLKKEREQVTASLESLYSNFTPSDGLGFGKRVGDGTQIAVERITEVRKQEILLHKLDEIEQAEKALEQGKYGFCRICGESIPPQRLEIRPQSLTCVNHA